MSLNNKYVIPSRHFGVIYPSYSRRVPVLWYKWAVLITKTGEPETSEHAPTCHIVRRMAAASWTVISATER